MHSYGQCHVNFLSTHRVDNLKGNQAEMFDLQPQKRVLITDEQINCVIIFYFRSHI